MFLLIHWTRRACTMQDRAGKLHSSGNLLPIVSFIYIFMVSHSAFSAVHLSPSFVHLLSSSLPFSFFLLSLFLSLSLFPSLSVSLSAPVCRSSKRIGCLHLPTSVYHCPKRAKQRGDGGVSQLDSNTAHRRG